MNKAIVMAALAAIGLNAECGVANADERMEIAGAVASCVSTAMDKSHRSEAFAVAYCRCVIPQLVQAMPQNLRTTGTKEQGANFAARWAEENPVALGACLKTGESADRKS